MMRWAAHFIAAATVVVLILGCGSESSTSVTSPPTGETGGAGGPSGSSVRPLDLPALVAALDFGSVQSFPAARSILDIPVGLVTPSFDAALCSYRASAERFICPATNVGAMTFSRSFSLRDSTGAPIARTDATNVAALEFIRDATGSVYPPAADRVTPRIDVTEHSALTVTGVATNARVLSGTTTTHYDVAPDGKGVAVRSSVDLATTVAKVMLPASSAPSPWPLSGTITSDVTGAAPGGAPRAVTTTVHSVLTFNGTSMPVMVTTIGGVSVSCRIDLNGGAAPACP